MRKENQRTVNQNKVILDVVKECSTQDEIQFLINRYCGPSNIILSERRFGFRVYESDFTSLLFNNLLEDLLVTYIEKSDKIEE